MNALFTLLDFLTAMFVGNVWPLTLIFVALVILRQLREELSPIISNVVRGVANSAQSNATAYAIAIMFGLSASLSAFYDVFSGLDRAAFDALSVHQYLALVAKVMNPFIVAVLAYATQNKDRLTSKPPGDTKPPFPVPTQ